MRALVSLDQGPDPGSSFYPTLPWGSHFTSRSFLIKWANNRARLTQILGAGGGGEHFTFQ